MFELEASQTDRLEAQLSGKRVVFVGEPDHFLHETWNYRCWMLRFLHARGFRWFAEELSWSDGARVRRFLASGDASELDRVTATGYRGGQRADRDDLPSGALRELFEARPVDAFRRAQQRFHRLLRHLGDAHFYGFDVEYDPGAGYELLGSWLERVPALQRVRGESLDDEITRVAGAHALLDEARAPSVITAQCRSLETGLRYVQLAQRARNLKGLRPAMGYREKIMHEHIDRVLDALPDGERLVLFGHDLHLARDADAYRLPRAALGPGGQQAAPVGAHVAARVGREQIASFWLLTGRAEGRRSGLGTLNRRLEARGSACYFPTRRDHRIELANGGRCRVRLPELADAIFFARDVEPMRREAQHLETA